MNWLKLLDVAKGYRTHVSTLIGVLTLMASLAGVLPGETAAKIAGVLGLLAITFSRLAQGETAERLDALLGVTPPSPSSSPPAAGLSFPAITRVTSLDGVTVGTVSGSDEIADLSDGPVTLRFPTRVGLLLIALLCLAQSGHAAEPRSSVNVVAWTPSSERVASGERTDEGVHPTADRPAVMTSMRLSPETRAWYRNPDGSCVQCSIGMAGVHCNDPNAASLLWDSPYGAAERGGSWPSRVEAYCDRRAIKAWSVTGASVDETLPWCAWAARTGRFAAIGAGQAHFQTLYGYDPAAKQWLVCNNNSTGRIDRYDEQSFRRLHAASGPWVVVLERPSSDPPRPVAWWK